MPFKMRTYRKCLKRQVENYSKIANSENTLKSKTPRFNLSTTWREKRENMLEIMKQTRLLLKFKVATKKVGRGGHYMGHF